MFDKFKTNFNKKYSSEEEKIRFEIFKMNVDEISVHNSKPQITYKLGINEFSDMTKEEFKMKFMSGQKHRLDAVDSMEDMDTRDHTDLEHLNLDADNHNADLFSNTTYHSPELFGAKRRPRSSSRPDHSGSTPKQSRPDALKSQTMSDSGSNPPVSAATFPIVNEYLNWVHNGAVAGVMDQQRCRSCYAFVGLAAIESLVFIETGLQTRLSVQEIVDCSKEIGNSGCQSGKISIVFDYVIKNKGVCASSVYPYTGIEGHCKAKKCTHFSPISSFVRGLKKSELELYQVVKKHPVAAYISFPPRIFKSYESGIFNDPSCGIDHTHGVLIVGYNSGDEPYWIVQNSWGSSWGENGYFRIAAGVPPENQCGIAMRWIYPVLKK